MDTEHVLVLGGDMLDASTIGPMTERRVARAALYAREHRNARLYVAPGMSPDFPEMTRTFATLMAGRLLELGSAARNIGPAKEFTTSGELHCFMEHVSGEKRKVVISARWHLLRVRAIIILEFGRSAASSFTYVASDDPLTLRLFVLETLKWAYLYTPRSLKSPMKALFRKLFGRSSW